VARESEKKNDKSKFGTNTTMPIFLSDEISIDIPKSSEREYTREGYLRVPAKIARTGIQEYSAGELGLADREPGDIVKIMRPADEVLTQRSLQSFAKKPITLNHPVELLDASNATKFLKGMTGDEVVAVDTFAETFLNIIDNDTIRAVENGKVEVSNGYTVDAIDMTSGITSNGEVFDGTMRGILGNHVAIVDRGRAGPDCRIADHNNGKGDNMADNVKVVIDGEKFTMSENAAKSVEKLQSQLSDVKKDEVVGLQKEIDQLKAKLDDAKAKILTDEQVGALVEGRLNVIDKARSLIPNIDCGGKNDNAIRREVVGAKCQSVNLDDCSKEYIDARFDILVEDNKNGKTEIGTIDDSFKKLATHIVSDEFEKTADQVARDKMIEDSKNAWLKKGNN